MTNQTQPNTTPTPKPSENMEAWAIHCCQLHQRIRDLQRVLDEAKEEFREARDKLVPYLKNNCITLDWNKLNKEDLKDISGFTGIELYFRSPSSSTGSSQRTGGGPMVVDGASLPKPHKKLNRKQEWEAVSIGLHSLVSQTRQSEQETKLTEIYQLMEDWKTAYRNKLYPPKPTFKMPIPVIKFQKKRRSATSQERDPSSHSPVPTKKVKSSSSHPDSPSPNPAPASDSGQQKLSSNPLDLLLFSEKT